MRFLQLTSVAALLLFFPHQAYSQGGEFTLSCLPLTYQRSDPIVSPGEPSAHTHVVVGGTAFSRTMGADTAPNATNTTCSVNIDRSNYWQPLLYHITSDGQFEAIPFQGNAVYYLNRACNYTAGATSCDASQYPLVPPAGLRMLAGDPMLRTYNNSNYAQRAMSHMCLTETDSIYTNSLPTQPCLRLRAQTFFPSCWDGVNLDSPDHTSHMSYPAIGDYNTGVCPESHPVAIFSIFLEFFYDVSNYTDWQNWVYAMGDPTGYGLHADFINGWTDLNALQDAFATCTGPEGENAANCSITNGHIQGAWTQQLEIPAPVENLGLTVPIPALPGNNPVTGSVSDRQSASSS
ncbi:hypothetical protein VTN77DRAFT_546 [Rasamsonia byssochlamydoides]|uniref:uncharacterized protein n=1 Tax=Rasamsonia byssochlamydoides TaxID=89139 RepID=UPI0037445878